MLHPMVSMLPAARTEHRLLLPRIPHVFFAAAFPRTLSVAPFFKRIVGFLGGCTGFGTTLVVNAAENYSMKVIHYSDTSEMVNLVSDNGGHNGAGLTTGGADAGFQTCLFQFSPGIGAPSFSPYQLIRITDRGNHRITVIERVETIVIMQTQPDIDYHPDEAKYRARTARQLAANPDRVQQPLPEGFPAKVEGPIVWEGKDWKGEHQWVYRLSASELQEINDALAHFKALNIPLGFIGRDTFPLPTLSPKLWELAQELYSGRGFFVLREIPVDKYTREELAIVYAGVSSHVGSARGKQDSTGAVLSHIKDLSLSHAADGASGNSAYTTDKQVFHTDVGDLIALLAIQSAAEGGTSRISSGGRVYNELATTRPDLVQTLSEPWVLDRFGGTPAYTMRPLLYFEDGEHVVIQYSRRHFTGYGSQKRNPNIPPITEAQAEALDAVHFLAEKYSLGLNFQKGDIQYINSMGLLHARDAFRDDAEHTRHLVRLWLRNDELAWKTPKPLEQIWKTLYSVTPEEQRFPLEPEVRKREGGGTK